MAGTDPRFNATEFRDAIRFAMQMGAPEDETKRVTFRWSPHHEFADADAGGSPFEWGDSATVSTAPDDVQIDCAIQFAATSNTVEGNAVAEFNSRKGVVILLDDDYDSIFSDEATPRRADLIMIDGDMYAIKHIYPLGLFEVTVYEIHIQAIDES